MSKIYDYDKNTFKRVIDKKGNITYFIKVDGRYIEVSKEVFLLLRRSYEKIKYDKKREVAKSVQYYGDIDLAASFIFNRKYYEDFTDKIYLNDLYMKTVDQIYKLPEKYKEIAICIFLKEMTIEETSTKVSHLPNRVPAACISRSAPCELPKRGFPAGGVPHGDVYKRQQWISTT